MWHVRDKSQFMLVCTHLTQAGGAEQVNVQIDTARLRYMVY